MKESKTLRLLFAGAAFATFAGQALALDGNDLLAKLNAASHLQGGTVSATSVNVSGSTVTLTGATLQPSSGTAKLALGNVVLEGVEEDNGGYTVEKVSFPDVNVTQDKATVTIADISVSGLSIPADASGDGLDSMLFYDEAETGPVNVSVDGQTIFSVSGSVVTATVADDKSSIGFDAEVKGIKADLSTVPDPKSKEAINDLGLQSIDGSMTMKGSWEIAPGTIDIEEYAFDFANVGKLDFAFSISGYTLQFLKSIQETAAAAEANPNKEEAQQAASLAMLGLMQQLTFNSAEISFEDAGITVKALDYAGKQQGVSGRQMAQMVKGMAPLFLAQLNVPELQNMVSTAVNAFIDDPGNLTISAAPAKPVPFPMIMGASMGAPNTLPQVLGVTVTANE